MGHPFTDVQVRVERSNAAHVVIALGTNLGDRGQTLVDAVAEPARPARAHGDAVSDIVATDPVGGPEQPQYLNAVVVGRAPCCTRTTCSPSCTASRPVTGARARSAGAQGPSTSTSSSTAARGLIARSSATTRDLTLPHPRAHERAFVLVPWSDADPRATLRVAAGDDGIRPVADLLADLDRSGVRPGPGWEQQ